MRHLTFIFLLFILINSIIYAQQENQDSKPLICGVKEFSIDPWLREFQTNPNSFLQLRSNNDILQLPLTIHLVAQNDGTGFLSEADLKIVLCELNKNFEPHNIRFYIPGNIRRYQNNSWYNLTANTSGVIHSLNGVNNTINVYIVNSFTIGQNTVAGFAPIGQNRVYLSKNSIRGVGNTTLTHEMGHCLNLYHTFLGWESAGIDYEPGTQAPNFVSNEITSFLVERVDRSNCTQAADGFCDTESDYLAYRWTCGNDSRSQFNLIDPTGENFRADGMNYMSYSNDGCQNRFSNQQVVAMRAHILAQKNNMIFSGALPDPVESPVSIVSPFLDEEVHHENIRFSWNRQSTAEEYYIEVSRSPTYAIIEFEAKTTDTTIVFNGNLLTNRNYYWRVTPFSKTDFCAPQSISTRFRTVVQTSTTDLEGNIFQVYPRLISGELPLTLEGRVNRPLTIRVDVINLNGRTLITRELVGIAGDFREQLPTSDLIPGMYLLRIYSQAGTSNIKFVKN
jgi:hypothetical protein